MVSTSYSIKDTDQIILVQVPNGAWFYQAGKSRQANHLQALETGTDRRIRLYRYFRTIIMAKQMSTLILAISDAYYYNPAYIYEVVDYTEAQKPLEDFLTILLGFL